MTPRLQLVFGKAKTVFTKGVAIITINKQGVEVATRISATLNHLCIPNSVYAPEQCVPAQGVPLDTQIGKFVKEIFNKVDAIVAVMAAGIVIRTIAPYLKSKLVDPAVVCVDVAGQSAISLLSGHYGGANELTRIIAQGIGATPVITTASDVLKKTGVDEVARILHCTIKNPRVLVAANTAVINGERLAIILVGDAKVPISKTWGYEVKTAASDEEAVNLANDFDAGAIITRADISMNNLSKPFAVLKLRRIIIGVGARKNIAEGQVLDAIQYALEKANVSLERIDGLATVDIKKDEQGMLIVADRLGFEYTFVSVNELRAFTHSDLSPDSKFVEEKIGVGGVCERAALIVAGKNPHLILKKQKRNGVTVAVAEGE